MHSNKLAIDLTEFKLGWRIVVLAMLGLAINANASMLYAFGTLVIPLQAAFGWARGDLQAARMRARERDRGQPGHGPISGCGAA